MHGRISVHFRLGAIRCGNRIKKRLKAGIAFARPAFCVPSACYKKPENPHKREDARYRGTWHVMKKLFENQKWKMSYGYLIEKCLSLLSMVVL